MALARQTGGQFILRIEDTDRQRFIPDSERNIFDSLHWLGIEWDEGPDVGGPHGPYRQSERLPLYRSEVDRLVDAGHAYRCWCSQERLQRVRKEMEAAKLPPKYDRMCLGKTEVERRALGETTETPVIRMRVPDDGVTGFDDMIRGRIEFENRLIDDQVLLKSDGFPTYHLAVVVDDHHMRITHILRGEEWISSTPKHVLLFEWFGWELPKFAHFPLLRNENQSKVSKRKNPWASLPWFREQGFLPEALLNFMALLGWSMPDGREIFTLNDFITNVDVSRISPTGPIFDLNKLEWMNGLYIRALSVEEFERRCRPYLEAAGVHPGPPGPPLGSVLPMVQERVKRLTEVADMVGFFYRDDVPVEQAALVPKGLDKGRMSELFTRSIDVARALPTFDHDHLETSFRELAATNDVKTGQLFMGLRVACTFSTISPPLFESMAALGRDVVVHRLERAVSALER
jgi:glutamyl-tRNA synthetase